MIPPWVGPLAELLNRVAELIERLWDAAKHKERQDKVDAADKDPAAAFAEHGRGELRDLPEAGEADKADV